MATCGINEQPPSCDDCLKVVRTLKTVHVPCKYNTYQNVTVKIPRQVNEQVPRTVKYTDYETRQRQVPYTITRPERRTRIVTQKYQVPVKRCYTVMQTKEKQVTVPYYVNVPETKYRTESHQVPVEKTKVQMDTVTKTVYDTQIRRRCVPQSRMCSKELPVYNVLAKPCGDCPADELVDDFSHMTVNGNGTSKYAETLGTVDAVNVEQLHVGSNYGAQTIATADYTGTVVDDYTRIANGNDARHSEVAYDAAEVYNGPITNGIYLDARANGNFPNTVTY